jgi:hypothetical protein
MALPLANDQLNYLLDFVGYGSLDADIWFLGMEEGGGGKDNIRTRLMFRQVEDCAEAHRMLGIVHHHWGKKRIQPTWRGMCCIMLELEGKPVSTEHIRNYQADWLGRSHGRTLLVELMPIPKPSLMAWGYQQLIPQFATREHYYRVVKPRRINYLRRLLREHSPSVVICYGKSYWSDYKELFGEATFTTIDQFQIAIVNNTLVILTDHFTARTMNNKWPTIVSIIKKYTLKQTDAVNTPESFGSF